MQRRELLRAGCSLALLPTALAAWRNLPQRVTTGEQSQQGPIRSVVPVVGDGRWIWTGPPTSERGYLEQRAFRLKTGIEIESTGNVHDIQATTPLPSAYAEQVIEQRKFDAPVGSAQVRQLTPGAAQLLFTVPSMSKGQRAAAYVTDELLLMKQYHGYDAKRFPAKQAIPNEVRGAYLQDSPGIETRAKSVQELAKQLTADHDHPWEQAQAFFDWVRTNIEPQLGPYTSVTTALSTRRGDCEEMAGVFVALCRAVNIPARLVWVPNHAWAEFYLTDHERQGHWIPAHTACYPWFGYTGAHELVLQKGDRLTIPQRGRQLRLVDDWLRWSGAKPRVTYVAELTPVAAGGEGDPGPGTRRKDDKGEWIVAGTHALDKSMRR